MDPEARPSQTVLDPQLDLLYQRRFSDRDDGRKTGVWLELVRYLERYVPRGSAVLDIACDRGHFIRNVRTEERWATDVRDVSQDLPPDVHFVRADGLRLAETLPCAHFDLVFMSNYLEHLPSSEAVIEQLRVTWQLLKPGGLILILQPNIRLVGERYWDFIDHHVPLTETSLDEAAQLAGFHRKKLITRFLPYTTKSRMPQHHLLVRAYLAFPPIWFVLGKQTLYLGERPVRAEFVSSPHSTASLPAAIPGRVP